MKKPIFPLRSSYQHLIQIFHNLLRMPYPLMIFMHPPSEADELLLPSESAVGPPNAPNQASL